MATKEHIDEAFGACFLRPVWGECWKIECRASVMAYENDPSFVETYTCVKPIHGNIERTLYDMGLNLLCGETYE